MEPNETVINYAAGTVLFREGEHGNRAYIIEDGVVEVSTRLRDEPLFLSLLGSGEIVGEMAIIDDASRSATAIVVADAKLRVIDREQLHERMRHADPIIYMLMQLITERYRASVHMLRERSGAYDIAASSERIKLSGKAVNKFRMEGELRSAIENRCLVVAYQPIVDLHCNHVVGFEALVRWRHTQKGFLPPQLFIALAEETNLIRAVDEFVLGEAIQALQQINRRIENENKLFIGVNVSGRQFEDTNYLETARELTQRHELVPELIKIEVTETNIAGRRDSASWIKMAKGYGFCIAIDDFGTGISNLSQLLQLNADTLKIDKSFIRNLNAVKRSSQMLKGIIELAKSMEMSVIAEGIETEYQRHLLTELGCQLGQGFFWGTPRFLEEILATDECNLQSAQ